MLYNITNIESEKLDQLLQTAEEKVDLSNYYYQENFFSQEEIDKIINQTESKTYRATTFSGSNESFRKSNIAWINPFEDNIDNSWLFKKIAELTFAANNQIYGFDIYGMFESIQYTVYDGSEEGFYCAHVDHGKNYYKRKLSVVVQLSDPANYSGGDLLLHTKSSPHVMPKGLGTTVIFPSWMLHEVTPVTGGVRRSLVSWVSGPPFK